MIDKELLQKARDQFAIAEEAQSQQTEEAQEDIRIYDGVGIWDQRLRTAREGDPKGARPCLVVSDLAPRVHQITNDVRQNRPSIKVRPVDDNADVETAEIFNGVVRHIEEQSNADIAYETGNFYQVVGGVGYFRVVEGFAKNGEGKELFIRQIANPFSVYMEPSLDPVGSDITWCFITEDIPRKQFEAEYPAADCIGWEEGDGTDEWRKWVNDDTVRVAEWFSLETKTKNVVKTRKGEMSEDDYWADDKVRQTTGQDREEVMETREDKRKVCMWRKIVGNKVLKEIELPITSIPVFRVPGEMLLVDGYQVFKGLVRDSRDAVRMVSYNFSAYVEAVSLQPKAPFVMAAGQDEGFEDMWDNANNENYSSLKYNPVDVNGQQAPPPQRSQPPMASQGLIQGLMIAKDALKDTTGMGAASLGQKGNETSGKAILARQREGDNSTYHFVDNLAKAIRQCGRVLIEWIPKVYSETKVARIIGEDGSSKQAYLDSGQKEAVRQVRDNNGKIRKIYNLGVGCYDVISTVGPGYTTKRVEMAEMMSQLFQAQPALVPILGDIFLGAQDVPGAERMAKRLKAMVPPQALAAEEEDEQAEIPPQVMAQMQQMQQQMQQMQEAGAQLQQENQQLKMEAGNKQGELQIKAEANQIDAQRNQIAADKNNQDAQLKNETNIRDNETRIAIEQMKGQIDQMALEQRAKDAQINALLKAAGMEQQQQQAEHGLAMDVYNAERADCQLDTPQGE